MLGCSKTEAPPLTDESRRPTAEACTSTEPRIEVEATDNPQFSTRSLKHSRVAAASMESCYVVSADSVPLIELNGSVAMISTRRGTSVA